MVPEHVLQETFHQARGAHPLSILGGQVSMLGTGHVLFQAIIAHAAVAAVSLSALHGE